MAEMEALTLNVDCGMDDIEALFRDVEWPTWRLFLDVEFGGIGTSSRRLVALATVVSFFLPTKTTSRWI